jgi:hypothetical protein
MIIFYAVCRLIQKQSLKFPVKQMLLHFSVFSLTYLSQNLIKQMKLTKSLLFSILIFSVAGLLTVAEAQDRHSNTELGIILGEPTGLSLKFWQSSTSAIDAAVAWSFGDNESVHLHADYLRHNWLDVDDGSLALYYGLGARALLSDNSRFGARIPVGLQYILPNTRLSLFFEVAPTLNLIPSTSFGVNGGLGIRVFL